MISVGINGFGRIGRAVCKIALGMPDLRIAVINDCGSDIANFAYLYNYDSTYGRSDPAAQALDQGNFLQIGDRRIRFEQHERADRVPWADFGVDILVDATGVLDNVLQSRAVVAAGAARRAIVTWAPPEETIDTTIIMGVNQAAFRPDRDRVVSSSICDANAIAHVLKQIDEKFGIEHGFVTSLHPWLSYQNLVDSHVPSQSVPGRSWNDYSLGRASTRSLIPKSTAAVSAACRVLPHLSARLDAISYRVPTEIVTSADMTLAVQSKVTQQDVSEALYELAENDPYVQLHEQALVGCDYIRSTYSAIIDHRWTRVLNHRLLKIMVWYDNEWGYSARVVDLVKFLAQTAK